MNYHNNDMPVAKSVGRKFRNDLIFIATLLLVLILAGAALFIFREEGTAVTITVDGILYGTYPLSQPLTLEIQTGENNEQINRLVIKDGKASVTYATCPDGICAAHRSISRSGESIVCLPNRIVITVQKGNEESPDIIV